MRLIKVVYVLALFSLMIVALVTYETCQNYSLLIVSCFSLLAIAIQARKMRKHETDKKPDETVLLIHTLNILDLFLLFVTLFTAYNFSNNFSLLALGWLTIVLGIKLAITEITSDIKVIINKPLESKG